MKHRATFARRVSSTVCVAAVVLLGVVWAGGPSYGQRVMVTPRLGYASFLGGSGYDQVKTTAVDSAGNIYLAGWTSSRDFPTVNALQPQYGGGEFDAFVAKLNPAGTALLFSTYLGGADEDYARGIAVDSAGNVYVAGYTQSHDFPLANALQPLFGGGYADAFVAKLGPSGSTLLYSTYLGGGNEDRALALALGGDGRPIVTGYTESEDFPLSHPLETYCGATTYGDVFVSKLEPSGGALAYSTYLCGSEDERGIAIAADSQGSAYVTGYTDSAEFPTTNAFQPQYAGYRDIFLTRLNPAGSAMLYSTYIGGTIDESGWGIAVDPAHNVYLTGFSRSPDFPLEHPIQPKLGGGDDGFVAKVAASGQALLYSTFLGGSVHDFGEGIAVDAAGGATLTGWTSSSDFPVVHALQPQWGGGADAFVAKVNPGGTAFDYSTFLGGGQEDLGWGVALDGAGEAIVAGHTYSADFPLANPCQPGYAGAGDGFVARVGEGGTPTPTPTATPDCGLAWRVVDSPNPGPAVDYLFDVVPISSNNVWAMGAYNLTSATPTVRPLALNWDGSHWSQVPTQRMAHDNLLSGLAAISANDIWAVGWYDPDGPLRTLTQHWDGGNWSIIPSPNVYTDENVLKQVVAIRSDDVWAAGSYLQNVGGIGTHKTLIEHWDGTEWSVIPSPNVGSDHNELWDIAAVTANDVWAVGQYVVGPNIYTLILHWDGSQWSVVPSPNPPGSTQTALTSVAVASANDVWAVGNSHLGKTLIEHWDGVEWSIIPSANPPADFSRFLDVTVVSANDVGAVGYYTTGNGTRTLVLHWDGTTWTQVPSPSPLLWVNELHGIGAVGANDIWSVGFMKNCLNCPWRTLIEHYSDPCRTSTPSPTPLNTATSSPTRTPSPSQTQTPPLASTATATAEPTANSTFTPSPCPLTFSDVHPADYFYQAVHFLYCHGAISGYADYTFRPFNNTTRAQLSKIVVLAEGWPLDCPQPGHFSDVPPGSPFFCYVETAYSRGVISGYADGTFRPGSNVTRGQTCKVVALAEGWPLYNPPAPTFGDVPPGDPFYAYIETAHLHNVISGYADGTFRPGASATRGQICKVIYLATVP